MRLFQKAYILMHQAASRKYRPRPAISGAAVARGCVWIVAAAMGLLCLTQFSALAASSPSDARPSPALLHDESLCLGCHENTVEIEVLQSSVHERSTCVDCHDDVTTVPHTAQPLSPNCDRCHHQVSRREFIGGEQETEPLPSIHESAKEKGATGTPDCVLCHGTHQIRPALAGASAADKMHMVSVCNECHPDITAEYLDSIHGEALAAGIVESPACADCHPEHSRDAEENGRDVLRGKVVTTCSSCHEDPGLQRRYALPAGRLISYLGSYHGAATELGEGKSANCASCHGSHNILPSSDPRSSIHKQNLTTTCGTCHPNAGEHFAEGVVHIQPSPTQDRGVFWVRTAYLVFIVGLMLAFLSYIGLDLLARIRGRIKPPQHEVGEEVEEPQFERLTLNQRIQHWVMIVSFTALLITGLPLAFPKAELSHSVINFLGGMGLRAIIHRISAIIQIGLCAYHIFYVLFSRKGYWEFRQLLPGINDIKDVLRMLGFYFGFCSTRARFHRYNFIEKFEYLAVGWGSVVMITTGVLLWKPEFTMTYLPKWAMDIALVVHGWEAILAFLAIIIWHMYNVHWNPSVFPMSNVWLTGKIGLEEFRENHPLEYEEYIAAREKMGDNP